MMANGIVHVMPQCSALALLVLNEDSGRHGWTLGQNKGSASAVAATEQPMHPAFHIATHTKGQGMLSPSHFRRVTYQRPSHHHPSRRNHASHHSGVCGFTPYTR
jgi:hypothetical protein